MIEQGFAAAEAWAEAHHHLAAWVQALGTPLALALTIWATRHSTTVAKRLATIDRLAVADAAYAEARSLDAMLHFIKKRIDPLVCRKAQPELRETSERLELALATPVDQWPTTDAYASTKLLKRVLDELIATLESAEPSTEGPLSIETFSPEDVKAITARVETVEGVLLALATEIDSAGAMFGHARSRRKDRISVIRHKARSPF